MTGRFAPADHVDAHWVPRLPRPGAVEARRGREYTDAVRTPEALRTRSCRSTWQARHDVLEQTCPCRDSDLCELARQLAERHRELGAAGWLDRPAHAPWIAFEALSRHRALHGPSAPAGSRQARGGSPGTRVLRTYARQAGEDRGSSGGVSAPVSAGPGSVGIGAAPFARSGMCARLAGGRAPGADALRPGARQLGQHAAPGGARGGGAACLPRPRGGRAVRLPRESRGRTVQFPGPTRLCWRPVTGRWPLTVTLRSLTHAR